MKKLFFISILLAVGLYARGQQKLSPKFAAAHGRIEGAEEMTFSISFKDSSAFISDYRGKMIILDRYFNTAWVSTSRDVVLHACVPDSNIIFIDIPQAPSTEAGSGVANTAFNRIAKAHAAFPGLKGAGINISIKERAFDPENIDVINRSFETPLTPAVTSQHAVNMAILIAGGGNSSSIAGLGAASAAMLTSSDFEYLLPDDDGVLGAYDIYLQNHSYGVEIENYYGNEAAAYDQQVYSSPALLHVFSAGNTGRSVPAGGRYEGLNYANLSGNFKQAKNVLLATAVDTTLQVNQANARGPAFDGRLKPELCAFGLGGTSDAAALVTGVSALIQQKYKQLHGDLPPAALVKAILIATADDRGEEGIDYIYGYGSMNAHRAIELTAKHHTAVIDMTSGEVTAVPLAVPENTAQLTVAVAWTDPAAAPFSDQALVHDINAVVATADTTHLPWVLSTAPDPDLLTAPAVRDHDSINNVEYFTIDRPQAGAWKIVVRAPALVTASQQVAVAWWAEDDAPFEWDFPCTTDILPAAESHTLFWNHHTEEPGELALQLNGGAWQPIASGIDLGTRFYWTPPDTLAVARLRMTTGGIAYLSEQFRIAPAMKMKVAYHCTGDFALTWSPLPGVDAYKVFTPGSQYMEEIATTTDTSVVMNKVSGREFFSVAPVLGATTGLRSPAINYTQQGALCYINFFLAERYDPGRVAVRLSLSTASHIEQVSILRTVDGREEVFATVSPGRMQEFIWYDEDLRPGAMRYQAVLYFDDGSSLYSDVSDVLIETKGKAWLFPNPIAGDDELNVLSEGEGLKIVILGNTGTLLIEKDLAFIADQVSVQHLPRGIYFYRLMKENKMIDAGKFVRE